MLRALLGLATAAMFLTACTTSTTTVVYAPPPTDAAASATQATAVDFVVHGSDMPINEAACAAAGLDPADIAALNARPLFELNEAETDRWLRYLHATEPDPVARLVRLARKNLGQPYEIYLLGEAPFEFYDPQPLYCLGKGDCVVFTEHMLAMAHAGDWTTFFPMLQRIRYKDGQIGVATRNHYTEADWNTSNRWLLEDITEKIASNRTKPWSMRIDRADFLRGRYKLESDFTPITHSDTYIPYDAIPDVEHLLQPGDVVNIVRGIGSGRWVGHVGLITRDENGQTMFLHSTPPASREEPLSTYIERSNRNREANLAANKAVFEGFKFLRVRPEAMDNLRAIDGENAPRLRVPAMHATPVVQQTAKATE
jgi:hypothetical protein